MKKLALVAVLAFVGYLLFTLGGIKVSSNFKAKLDSLDKVNDSLVLANHEDDSTIVALTKLDSSLVYKVEHQKAKVVKIKEYVEI